MTEIENSFPFARAINCLKDPDYAFPDEALLARPAGLPLTVRADNLQATVNGGFLTHLPRLAGLNLNTSQQIEAGLAKLWNTAALMVERMVQHAQAPLFAGSLNRQPPETTYYAGIVASVCDRVVDKTPGLTPSDIRLLQAAAFQTVASLRNLGANGAVAFNAGYAAGENPAQIEALLTQIGMSPIPVDVR
jgi:hypothetical protein